jgi:hypothetical protein
MLVEIFYHIDEFCKDLKTSDQKKLLLSGNKKRNRQGNLLMSEIVTIIVYYHYSGYKTFKDYYQKHVLVHLKNDFNPLVSYNRFIELKPKALFILSLFVQMKKSGTCTGISIIDSFPIEVCHIKRASSHKTFNGIAKKGKTSVGWFYGLKLHATINHLGEILSFVLTPGNIIDNNPRVVEKITQNFFGKLIGDKGYIGRAKDLARRGIQLLHRLRKNMKQVPIFALDALLLAKRALIETVGGLLKQQFSLEHTRHRSKENFLVHIFSTIAAYSFKAVKPSININVLQPFLIA